MCFVSVHVVHLYSSIGTATAWKKSYFILSDKSNLYIIDNQSIALHATARSMSTSLSVDEILIIKFYTKLLHFIDTSDVEIGNTTQLYILIVSGTNTSHLA